MFDRQQGAFQNMVYTEYDYRDPVFLNRCLHIYKLCKDRNRLFAPNLAFAFERPTDKVFPNAVLAELLDVEVLTIIGYSFL